MYFKILVFPIMCFMNYWEGIIEIRYFNYILLLWKD